MIDTAPPASLIVPRIVLELPETGGEDMVLSPEDSLVERHLVADLSVAYAFDRAKWFEMVARHDLARLNLDERSIDAVAISNLIKRMDRLEPEFQQLSIGVFILVGAGDFTAATLVLNDVWQQAMDRLHSGLLNRGALVAAVPARDMLAFTSAENRRGVAFMRSRVSQVLEQGDHTLTRHFLVRREGSWNQYEGYAG